MKTPKQNKEGKKHKHRFKLAQITKESNFEKSMCSIYQDKAYVVCEDCGFVKRQWL